MLTVKFDISTDSDKPIRVKLDGLTGLENIDNLTIKEVLNQPHGSDTCANICLENEKHQLEHCLRN